jgi:glycosyltransferase involved in cell wall biosynthesis
VAASQAGGLPDAVGPCGTTFGMADLDDLTQTLHSLLTRPALREHLQRDAEKHLQHFDPTVVANRYLEIFHRSIAPGQSL